MEKIQQDSVTGCWNWQGSITASGGYGQFSFDGQPRSQTIMVSINPQ
jgi:hypothetical protein